ncbi:MAG: hypothetical protein ABDH37_06710 [Candidatus Hydrothermales bacterium]
MLKIILFGQELSKIKSEKNKKLKNKKKKEELSLIEKIKRAIELSKKLEIEYIDNDGKETKRVIKLEKADYDKILAYFYLRNSWRSFKISRIKKIKII